MTRRQPLSPEQIKAAIASGEFHKLADGESLYCVVRNGRAFWVGQFWRDGKVASCGLGAFADTSPPAARKAWQAMKTQLRNGTAPAARARTVALPSNGTVVQAATARTARPFADACAAYLEARRGDWGDSRHDTKLQIVRDYLGPIAKVRVDRLTVDDVVGVLRPKWSGTGSNTGTHLRSIIENVLGAEGVPVNVAAWATLKHRLTTSPAAKAPHASMAWKDATTLWSKLAGNESSAARALKLLMLCGTRAGETLAADWSEFDLAERFGRSRPHTASSRRPRRRTRRTSTRCRCRTLPLPRSARPARASCSSLRAARSLATMFSPTRSSRAASSTRCRSGRQWCTDFARRSATGVATMDGRMRWSIARLLTNRSAFGNPTSVRACSRSDASCMTRGPRTSRPSVSTDTLDQPAGSSPAGFISRT